MSIPIFKSEIDLGLADQIAKSNSIAYYTLAEKSKNTEKFLTELKAIAATKNYSIELDGLYPVDSVLVSTVWNKNDDVLDKLECWMARNTPIDKPTNINHDQRIIVGHMVNCTVVDDNGNIINDSTPVDELPDLYHIIDSAVIYAKFDNQEMMELVSKLINDIETGKMYVSMECFFRNFDYALQNEDGSVTYIERNESTAFLTKSLRMYGGTGTYIGRKLGRVLRGITFIGRGYVEEPANPDSIILSKDNNSYRTLAFVKELKSISGVCNSNENGENEMSEELQNQVNELTGKLEAALAQVNQLTEQVNSLTSTKSELETEIVSLNEKNTVLARENDGFKVEKINMQRANVLLSGGFTPDEAQAKITVFANLSDEQFEVIAQELVEAKKSKSKDKDMTGEDKTKCDTKASVDVLADVVPEQVVVPVADTATAGVRQMFSEALLASKKK